jgi:hypothetical protein
MLPNASDRHRVVVGGRSSLKHNRSKFGDDAVEGTTPARTRRTAKFNHATLYKLKGNVCPYFVASFAKNCAVAEGQRPVD